MKQDMTKCENCKNLDTEKSNHNWTVCPVMPVAVMIANSSRNCEKFEEKAKP
jgi:hypothetical protein